jgi:23S rRNA U2552 (ribose-2'-O)-methylase RlmE/FtsJ
MARWVKKWAIEGSNGNVWIVSRDEGGRWGCSCPQWKFRRKNCKHIIAVMLRGEEDGGRQARPGNVGEVVIDEKENVVLYPLVPIEPFNSHLVATIIYDLMRAGVDLKQVEEYRKEMLPKVSLNEIVEWIKGNGRLVYEFVEGEGWTKEKIVPADMPIRRVR